MSDDRNAIIDRLSPILARRADVDFVILFGSAATGKLRSFSDVDIALHTPQPIEILDLGRLASDLEVAAGRAVDILELRGLQSRNPALAFAVLESGRPFLVRNEEALVQFRKSTFLSYMDTAPLRKRMNDALLDRIRRGTFGRSRNVG
jgi:uncharacterized protein